MAGLDQQEIEERIRRYRALLRYHSDPMAVRALETIIREMEARLAGDPTPQPWR